MCSPDGKLVVFLSAEAAVDSGAHCATNSLHAISWPEGGVPTSQLHVRGVVSPLSELFSVCKLENEARFLVWEVFDEEQ